MYINASEKVVSVKVIAKSKRKTYYYMAIVRRAITKEYNQEKNI